MFKKITLLLLILQHISWGQDFSKDWVGHFSYNNILAVANSNSKIYAAANNSIFIHSFIDGTNEEFTTINGLSAEDIQLIRYIEERKLVVVGFKNGLVEFFDEETKQTTTLNDIPSTSNLPPASVKINDIFENNGILYIATGFGIVEYDLDKNAFANTYLISNSLSQISDITAVSVSGNFIIASIKDRGVFRGNIQNQNLILAENWELIQPQELLKFGIFSEQLFATDDKNIYLFNGTSFIPAFPNTSDILNFSTIDNKLYVTYTDKIIELDTQFTVINEISLPEKLIDKISFSVIQSNEIFYTTDGEGLQKTTNQQLENSNTVSPEGPLSNNIYSIEIDQGDLWLSFGLITQFFGSNDQNINGGISRLRDKTWLNIPNRDFNLRSISDIKIDPNNKDHVYFSSFGDGLLEYTNGNLVTFDNTNSNISSKKFVLQLGLDASNSLWFVDTFNTTVLRKFTTSGEGEQIDLEGVLRNLSSPNFNFGGRELVFDSKNNIYFGTRDDGVVGINASRNKIINLTVDNNNLPSRIQTALTIDLDGDLWIGTENGLRIVRQAESIFEPGNELLQTEAIIFEDDGVAQELLFEQRITDIKVDSENNKWVSTITAGAFQFSPDGQEILQHFTTSNSPLPTNEITEIAINSENGSVFFVSAKGLAEFKSDIVEAQEDLSQFKVFPNPFRPEYGEVNVRIEGLTAGANVKITDIEGNLVYEDQNSVTNGTGSGLIEWDTKSFSGKKVASGVYLILVTSEDQLQTTVGKLLIVR